MTLSMQDEFLPLLFLHTVPLWLPTKQGQQVAMDQVLVKIVRVMMMNCISWKSGSLVFGNCGEGGD